MEKRTRLTATIQPAVEPCDAKMDGVSRMHVGKKKMKRVYRVKAAEKESARMAAKEAAEAMAQEDKPILIDDDLLDD